MTDAQLRALVREAVERHLGTGAASLSHPCGAPAPIPPPARQDVSAHPSHHLYLTVVNTTEACVIEPSVPCDHCGYCKSHGH